MVSCKATHVHGSICIIQNPDIRNIQSLHVFVLINRSRIRQDLVSFSLHDILAITKMMMEMCVWCVLLVRCCTVCGISVYAYRMCGCIRVPVYQCVCVYIQHTNEGIFHRSITVIYFWIPTNAFVSSIIIIVMLMWYFLGKEVFFMGFKYSFSSTN